MEQDIIDTVLQDPDATTADFGSILVIGGSERFTNTPAIAGLGALRTGCNFVDIAAPEPSIASSRTFALNVISTPLNGDRILPGHVDALRKSMEWADALVVGPGVGRDSRTQEALAMFLQDVRKPAVIDAGAIRVVRDNPDIVEHNWVITPHVGEFRELTGEQPTEDTDQRMLLVEQYTAEFDCTILLKGPVDIITSGGETTTVEAGNRYMAQGGTGDVLAGVTAALLARHDDPVESTATAAWVNGKAGDRALDHHGPGFILEELLQAVADVVDERRG
jgi:NAD(P)H-hydrate epimerase